MRRSSPWAAVRPWPGARWPDSGTAASLHLPVSVVGGLAAQVVAARAQPWLQPLQPALDAVLAACQAGASVAQALNQWLDSGTAHQHAATPDQPCLPVLQAGPLRFVPQAALPAGEAYEAFVHRTAQVPTRDNLHDLFNGLVWLAHPALKRRLNALQAAELARGGSGPVRGALRDALTLFDESGALLCAPPPLVRALRARDWAALFITHRGLWPQARLQVVGHALLDQLCTAPRKGLTAKVMVLDQPPGDEPIGHDGAQSDAHLAGQALGDAAAAWSADVWSAKPFCPLPVLGVPGWWAGNALPGFYDDAAVFRPPRHGAPPAPTTARQAGRKPSIDR